MAAKKTAKKTTKTTAKQATKKVAKKATAKKAPAKKAAKKAPVKKAVKAKAAGPSIDEITRAAYLVYLKRTKSGTPGDSHSDWIEAEKQLSSE